MYQVYRNQCVCRLASVLTESCHTTNGQIEAQHDCSQKYSVQLGFGDKDAGSVKLMEYKRCNMARFEHDYLTGGSQSSVTKFRFQDNRPVEICDEWYYTIQNLKSLINSLEESLNDLGVSSAEDVNDLHWFARPYHFTKDDIIDIHRLRSPDERIPSAITDFSVAEDEVYDGMSQKYSEKSSVDIGVPADRFPSVLDSNATNTSLDRFLACTSLAAVCNIVPFYCSCQDLLRQGGPAELLPYLDAKTFYSGFLIGLGQSCHGLHVLQCDAVSQPLVMDSSGLLCFGDGRESRLLSSGTSVDLTPGGNGDKQKLPNIDQLRAIQDNLAYNVCLFLHYFSVQKFLLTCF